MSLTTLKGNSLSLHWIRFFQKGIRIRIFRWYGSICFKGESRCLCITFMRHWDGITWNHKNKHLSHNLDWQPLWIQHARWRIFRKMKWLKELEIYLQLHKNHLKKYSVQMIRIDVALFLTINLKMPSESYN